MCPVLRPSATESLNLPTETRAEVRLSPQQLDLFTRHGQFPADKPVALLTFSKAANASAGVLGYGVWSYHSSLINGDHGVGYQMWVGVGHGGGRDVLLGTVARLFVQRKQKLVVGWFRGEQEKSVVPDKDWGGTRLKMLLNIEKESRKWLR